MYIRTCVLFGTVYEITAVSLYIAKIVDNKEVLRTVSNTGIYCSNDKAGTV
jgi:predicted transport protein